MSFERRLFITGTYRCGGNFLANRLNVAPEALILGDLFHFFRFVEGQYEPRDVHAVRKVCSSFRHRLERRFELRPEFSEAELRETEPNDPALYDLLARSLVALDGEAVRIFGEKTAQDWNRIPLFLDLFPDGRALHAYRDPRAVLSSWKKVTIQPRPLYLDAIFNCLDSFQKARQQQKTHGDRILRVGYEEFMSEPERGLETIADFIGLEAPERLLAGSLATPFREHCDASFGSRGPLELFSRKSVDSWRSELEEWEVALVEHVCGEEMEAFGYTRALDGSAPPDSLFEVFESHPYLSAQWERFRNGEPCRAGYPNDPRKPQNWGPRKRPGAQPAPPPA